MNKCKCGCGKNVKKSNIYIKGHFTWNKNKDLVEKIFVKCSKCQKNIKRNKSRFLKVKNSYCNMDCYKPKTKFKKFKCLQCHKQKEISSCKERKFCSLSCNTKYRNFHSNPMNNLENRKKASITRKKLIKDRKVKFFGNGLSPSRPGKMNFWYGKKRNGKLNPNWKNGISFEPYSSYFNEDLKEKIRTRDEKKCQLCSMPEYKNYWGKLTPHHIDYNKKNCSENNLITLCTKCNVIANYEREKWTLFYQTFMEEKYKERGLFQ